MSDTDLDPAQSGDISPPGATGDPSAAQPADIVARFLDIYRYLNHYSRALARDYGISGRKLSALRYLQANVGAKIGDLSDYLHISDSSTSELVSELEQRGLARRQRCDDDNRVVRVYVTADAEELLTRTPLAGISLMRERLAAIDEQDRAAIGYAIERLADLMGVDAVQF